ncbi:molybdenum ABC transporter, periplasmic molybdate-binding protein [Caldicellulosiruptor kronotskyensis 2002]|uniref:Molybdenum ABC transporter, periplasmic molybdate-binding protein n=1 Tax=Caldicellulosiruptor kronotskyensis (strain DSM 18902 / VKM B-2412 / 2002) TaxID=632348 RepID=E4SGT1_CALK2|nr:molybdate ABC transporter substrate-binding protein [Caldicellulosiruptor kronotskyensis]ADQ46956.1 molybdenum ABC transporter, periplasmic molybdate-binding protein [Caldicellulosiruptor kronotskyensis 2002]
MIKKLFIFKMRCVYFFIIASFLFSTVSNVSFSKDKTKKESLIVFVPNTLESIVKDISKQFEKQKSCKVVFNVAGTHVLVTQLKNGAMCDVFFSADRRYIDSLKKAKYIDKYEIFAKTKLCVISSSPSIKKFEDISKKGIRLCIADPVSPIGMYTKMLIDKIKNDNKSLYSGIIANIISQEFELTDVIQKVKVGEADAGIVYFPDAKLTKLKIIDIPDKYNVVASHYVAAVEKAKNPKFAKDFISFIKTKTIAKLLKEKGYE